MPNILYLKTVFLFLISLSMQSQTKVYVDENMQEIDSANFYNKCDARVFKCLTYKTDSLIVNKVHNRFKFGKISTEKFNQVRLLLMKKGNIEITPDQILVIEQIDTIGGNYLAYLKHIKTYHLREYNKKTKDIDSAKINFFINDKPAKVKYKRLRIKSNKSYNRSYKAQMKSIAKCKKKFEKKFNTSVFTMYKLNTGENILPKTLDLISHSEITENAFFNQIHNAHFVILKPDGEYFISSKLIKDSYLFELFKNRDWSKHINDLELSKTQNTKFAHGIFKPFVAIEENPLLCF